MLLRLISGVLIFLLSGFLPRLTHATSIPMPPSYRFVFVESQPLPSEYSDYVQVIVRRLYRDRIAEAETRFPDFPVQILIGISEDARRQYDLKRKFEKTYGVSPDNFSRWEGSRFVSNFGVWVMLAGNPAFCNEKGCLMANIFEEQEKERDSRWVITQEYFSTGYFEILILGHRSSKPHIELGVDTRLGCETHLIFTEENDMRSWAPESVARIVLSRPQSIHSAYPGCKDWSKLYYLRHLNIELWKAAGSPPHGQGGDYDVETSREGEETHIKLKNLSFKDEIRNNLEELARKEDLKVVEKENEFVVSLRSEKIFYYQMPWAEVKWVEEASPPTK